MNTFNAPDFEILWLDGVDILSASDEGDWNLILDDMDQPD